MNLETTKKIGGYSLLLIGLFTLSLPFLRLFRGNHISDVRLAEAKVASFDVTLNLIGALDAANSLIFSSEIKSNRAKILYIIPDGKFVQKDDILIKFDPTTFEIEISELSNKRKLVDASLSAAQQAVNLERTQVERSVKKAEYNYKIARLNVQKTELGEGPLTVAQHRDEMLKAEQKLYQLKAYKKSLLELKGQGFDNPSEIVQATQRLDEANSIYETAKEKYHSYKDYVLPALIEAAKAEVQNTEMELVSAKKAAIFQMAKVQSDYERVKSELTAIDDQLNDARSQLDRTIIKAPFPAIAVLYETMRDNRMRKPMIGDSVWQNQPLLYLPQVTNMVVNTSVRESDLRKVRQGQKATVTVDSYPGEFFDGSVFAIGALASKRPDAPNSDKIFNLTITILGKTDRLRPGMTARVSILANSVKDAVTVPVQAIFNDRDRYYCYLSTGSGLKKTGVVIGSRNNELVEIRSGLKSGDRVSLVYPGRE